MERIRIKPFVPYKDAFEEFTKLRKEINDLVSNDKKEEFKELFKEIKIAAAKENTVAMDILAYYYKTGIEGFLHENYKRYISWQLVAAARGNEFAIEKLQFLIGYACDAIILCEDYELIKYKNDIFDDNILYVLGKAVAKMLVKELKIYPIDLYTMDDDYVPFRQEHFVNLRHDIDNIIPKTIAYLKS